MYKARKVLFVIDQYKNPYAGTEGQLYKLIKFLQEKGVECHLLVFSSSEFLNNQAFPCAVSVLGHHRLSSLATWRALWQFAKRFKALGFSLVHIFFNDPSIIGPPVFRLNGFRVLISRRDMGYWYTPTYTRLLRMNRFFLSGAVTNSGAVKRATAEVERIPLHKIHVIYNGYEDLENSMTTPDDWAEFVDHCDVVIGMVANIRPIKRMEDAIEALAQIYPHAPNVKLIVIGDGDASSLLDRAQKLGIYHRVRVIGARNNAIEYIRRFDIGVLCSQSEGFSNALIEYMQCGKPVVCSRVGGNPEIVQHGMNGFLYDVGDTVSLAAHLLYLIETKDARERMGKSAQALVRNQFSMEKMVNAHLDLYDRLLGTNGVAYA